MIRRIGLPTRLLRALGAASSFLLGAACVAGQPMTELVDEINATLEPYVYIAKPGDSLAIAFQYNKELNQTVSIRKDGVTTLPLLGETELVGYTLDQLREHLKELYEEVLHVPEISVRVVAQAPKQVILFGAIRGQGPIPLGPRGLSLREALALRGGYFPARSNLNNTVLIRWMAEERQYIYWVIDCSPEYWRTPDPLWLQANDLVYVPQHPFVTTAQWMQNFLRLLPFPGPLVGAAL